MENKLYDFIKGNNNVIDVEIEENDLVADYDFLVSFKNNKEVLSYVESLKFTMENKFGVNVHILYDQLADQLLEPDEIITIDFYCYV